MDNQHGFGLGQLADPGALLYTSDGGDTWQKIYSFAELYRPSQLSFMNRSMGWVAAVVTNGDKNVMLKTTDGGNNWTPIDINMTQTEIIFASYFRFFDADNGILATTDAGAPIFYRTQDGGRTWELTPQNAKRGTYQFSFLSPRQGWELSLAGSSQNTVTLQNMADDATWQDRGQISASAFPYGIDFMLRTKPIAPGTAFQAGHGQSGEIASHHRR